MSDGGGGAARATIEGRSVPKLAGPGRETARGDVASSKKQGLDDWQGRNHDADEADHLSLLLHADAKRLAKPKLDPLERGKLLTRVRRTQRAYLGHDPQAETRERRRIIANALQTAQHAGADRAKALAIARAVLTLGTYPRTGREGAGRSALERDRGLAEERPEVGQAEQARQRAGLRRSVRRRAADGDGPHEQAVRR